VESRAWLMVVIGAVVAACNSGSGSTGVGAEDTGAGFRAGPGPQGGRALYSQFRSGQRLVLQKREPIAVTPADFRDRLATMETTPGSFDGVFLCLPTTGNAITRGAAVTASAIAKDLEPLYALKPTRLRYNFAVVPMQRDLDPFDDWSVVIANVAALAKVAREAGLVGIVIDNEVQAGLRADHPHDRRFPTRTLADYRAQTQLVGRKIMQAIVTEFPDATVVVQYRAAGADPSSPVNRVRRQSETAQLLGSLFAGFAEAKVASSLLVKGGIDDDLQGAEPFDAAAAWHRTELSSATIDSAFTDTIGSTF